MEILEKWMHTLFYSLMICIFPFSVTSIHANIYGSHHDFLLDVSGESRPIVEVRKSLLSAANHKNVFQYNLFHGIKIDMWNPLPLHAENAPSACFCVVYTHSRLLMATVIINEKIDCSGKLILSSVTRRWMNQASKSTHAKWSPVATQIILIIPTGTSLFKKPKIYGSGEKRKGGTRYHARSSSWIFLVRH